MKKILYSMLMLAMAAFTFTSCEDVPAPYDDPNKDETGGVTVVPEGNGTLESPFNCAAANEFAESLGADNESEVVYIKGKIVSIVENYDGGYGNATFYISDDGTTNGQFYVYRSLYLGNKKYSSGVLPEIGDDVIICGKIVNYRGNTPETVQNGSYLYSLNSQSEGGSTVEGEAKGDGTLENPYNSIAANKLASSLADGTESENVYIKGKIASIKEEFGTQFGNATFYISEDGTDNGTFYVFRTLYLGNQKYTGGDNIKVGDEVIIYGKVTNYMGNTPETVANASYLYSLNGKTAEGGSDTPTDGATGDGTEANPYNSIAANNIASALADGETTDVVYIKGKVASIKEQYGTQYGNATFYISDDGTANGQFYVFRALYLNNVKYTEGEVLHVGDEVVVCGKLCNYMGNTPETVANESYLHSLKCNGATEEPENPGTTTPDEGSLLSNGTFEAWSNGLPVNWKTATTAGNATLSQSTDAHGGKYSVSVGYVTSANKRLGYKETELEAGKYKFSFWAKATKGGKSQTRTGYTPVVDGKVGNYVYGDYVSLSTSWTEVTYEFELTEKTTICLVIMNPKNSSYSESQEILVDDAKLVKM
ncbi:MAG: hypothetical protein J6C66_04070 [Prevotella sp.]|nr:hypothetical protein [Prevotella sp.]MBQ8628343.1 hypothetical protein [Prevotella sp.]